MPGGLYRGQPRVTSQEKPLDLPRLLDGLRSSFDAQLVVRMHASKS